MISQKTKPDKNIYTINKILQRIKFDYLCQNSLIYYIRN